MKVDVKISYIAEDGTVFLDKDECLAYEEAYKAQNYKMFTDTNETNDIGEANFVLILNNQGALDFQKVKEEDGETHYLPCHNNHPTVYFWNADACDYVYLPNFVIQAIKDDTIPELTEYVR